MEETQEKKITHNEDDKLMIDHSYDGIQELDNRPPPWIMWLFYITVIWSALYGGYYHWFWQEEVSPQESEYQAELLAATEKQEKLKASNPEKYSFDETKITLFSEAADLDAGKALYAAKGCVACHGNLGEGNAVGPNLTDEAWLNGNTPADVFKVIKHGNPAKGMMAYKDQMTNDEIQKLTSWILVSLKGSNPPNAKAPQGN